MVSQGPAFPFFLFFERRKMSFCFEEKLSSSPAIYDLIYYSFRLNKHWGYVTFTPINNNNNNDDNNNTSRNNNKMLHEFRLIRKSLVLWSNMEDDTHQPPTWVFIKDFFTASCSQTATGPPLIRPVMWCQGDRQVFEAKDGKKQEKDRSALDAIRDTSWGPCFISEIPLGSLSHSFIHLFLFSRVNRVRTFHLSLLTWRGHTLELRHVRNQGNVRKSHVAAEVVDG